MKRNSKREMAKIEEKKNKIYQKPLLTKYRQLKKIYAQSPIS